MSTQHNIRPQMNNYLQNNIKIKKYKNDYLQVFPCQLHFTGNPIRLLSQPRPIIRINVPLLTIGIAGTIHLTNRF